LLTIGYIYADVICQVIIISSHRIVMTIYQATKRFMYFCAPSNWVLLHLFTQRTSVEVFYGLRVLDSSCMNNTYIQPNLIYKVHTAHIGLADSEIC